ncbi:MAG TPA: DUF2961 domain-containing protein [Phycisphaerae bacterium]|nr:DUF2961 domain-containing protein [Phycisphaerae bacterium]HRY70502.1 DUF2961 domain-containing protein [Phycisphaerae bacterium]HSA28231.1 DUF2961 domain-containing protein [Phycisphaerae bacterium]
MFAMTGLAGLPLLRNYRSRRESSYDRTGANRDWMDIKGGTTRTIAKLEGPGCIRHIWNTMLFTNEDYFRRVVLRFFWDDCPEPSVECPIGDYFGLGHGKRKNFVTAVMQMSPQDGRAFNCWWPMPFRKSARIEIENPGDETFPYYYYIDYESYDSPAVLDGQAFFHVQWRRENPTGAWGDEYNHLMPDRASEWREKLHFGGDPRALNKSNRDNYVMLDAVGDGIYCGAHLNIDVFERQKNEWYGEGDDMIFIDGEPWPPSLHGTGTEDWCNTAFGPSQEYTAPYHGILLYSGDEHGKWRGKQTIYRYHIEDPIRFRKSIHVSIEHGHANKLGNDYSSTAYYYLSRPARGGVLLPVEQRLPRPDPVQNPPQ